MFFNLILNARYAHYWTVCGNTESVFWTRVQNHDKNSALFWTPQAVSQNYQYLEKVIHDKNPELK